jgi:hypothetical protein
MSTLKRKFRLASLCLVATIGTAHADQVALSGDWFMEGTENGAFMQFIHHRDKNGTFWVQIRILEHCQPKSDWVESGTWTLIDDKIDQTTTVVQGHQAHYHDEFFIKSSIGNSFTNYDPDTGITWQVFKVPSDFTFPDPKSCAIS